MGTDAETGVDRDNLSSISTILGLTLFCLLIVTIFTRRWMVHRQNRRFARERLAAAATIIGHGPRRGGSEGTENDEPRTIAIGARAALLRQPFIWENHLSSPELLSTSEKRSRGSCWDHLQPTALQLLSPHTTAHFPKRASQTTRTNPDGQSRIARAYSHFLFHRDHANPSVAPPPPSNTPNPDLQPSATPPPPVPRASSSARAERRVSQASSTTPRRHSSSTSPAEVVVGEAEKKDDDDDKKDEDGTYPHPVHLTFLISMPSASSPSYPTTTSQPPTHIIPNPHLTLGTTQPTARLPSILLKQDELDSWWDLPTPSYSPFLNTNNARFYTSPTTTGLTAGQMIQLEVERERAEREAQRARILQVGLGGGGSGAGGGAGTGRGMGYSEYVALARAVRR